jgi:hypothetical protein
MKMRVLLAVMVLPFPTIATEFKIGESGPVSVMLPAIWIVYGGPLPPAALTSAIAALNVPACVSPEDVVPGSTPAFTTIVVCASTGENNETAMRTIAAIAVLPQRRASRYRLGRLPFSPAVWHRDEYAFE